MSTVAENNFDYEDYSIMCYLPNEILSRIFAILRAEDRKSVRLVCSSWYQYATCVSVTKNEKFVFRRTASSIEDVTKVMLKLNYSNLEFQDHSIEELPARIWEVCGHKIHSLEFFQCHVDAQTIRNIVIHCENMTTFTFGTRDTELCKEIFCSSQLFEDLVENGIQRTKLNTFAMLIYDPLGEIVLSKLFLVYPCITHFVAETLSPYWFSYFPISLESLQFKRTPYKPNLWMKACITKSEHAGLRLRQLEGVFHDMDQSYVHESLLNFLLSQKDLNSVTLKLEADEGCHRSHQVFKNIIFQILECCPGLQKFRIELRPVPCFEQEELRRLHASISKLRCLSLCFDVPDSSSIFLHQTPGSLLLPKLLTHLTTLELRLEHSEIKDDLYALLFENCPSLLHLSVGDSLSDHTLQILFKCLLKLQTLYFWAGDNWTDYGFIGHNASGEGGYSVKRLRQLKRLYVEDLKYVQGAVGEILLEFQFPHLEYLCLDIEVIEMLSEEELIRFSGQIPNLKQLELMIPQNKAWSKKIIVNLCKYLRNLHGLIVFGENQQGELKDFVMEHSEELFSCPSLRFISNLECSTFCFNVLTHTVEERNHGRVKFKIYMYDDIFMYL